MFARRAAQSLSSFGSKTAHYFLSVSFDLSTAQPFVLPPKEAPPDCIYRVNPGEVISFTLGEGIPLFPPRVIQGGLVVYLTVCEADKGVRHIGEVMEAIHKDLKADDSLVKTIAGFVKDPAGKAVETVLSAASAAMQPIATILKNSQDEFLGVFNGIFPAKGPWDGKLSATNNGATIQLGELR
jgi:hypothetical protein